MIAKQTSFFFRGLAIIMVITSHYAGWMMEVSVYPEARQFLCGLGVLGVDIFFFLSGYGVVKSTVKKGVQWNFLRNRMKACYIPYLLVVGVIILLEDGFQNSRDVVSYLTGKTYWYINVQMVLYLCFFVCYAPEALMPENRKAFWRKMKNLLLTMTVIGFTYWLYALGRADFWELSNGAFLFGVYLAQWEMERSPKETKRIQKKIPIVLLIVSLAVIGFCHYRFGRTMLLRWEMIGSMAFSFGIAMVCLLFNCRSNVLGVLGRYSLYLYLVHGYVYRCVGAGLVDTPKPVILLVGLAMTLAAGLTTGYVIEHFLDWITSALANNIRHFE